MKYFSFSKQRLKLILAEGRLIHLPPIGLGPHLQKPDLEGEFSDVMLKFMNKVVPVSITLFIKEIGESGFSIWMQKRLENGLWEFPGGKIEAGESAKEAALREVWEEVGLKIPLNPLNFKTYPYFYQEKSIILHVFLCHFFQIPKDLGIWEKIDFKSKSGYLVGKIPPINHLVIDEVADYLMGEHHHEAWKNLWRH